MAKCTFCKKSIEFVSAFKCKFCGKFFCPKHRLPESHNCRGLKRYNAHNKWRRGTPNRAKYIKQRNKQKKRERTPVRWHYEANWEGEPAERREYHEKPGMKLNWGKLIKYALAILIAFSVFHLWFDENRASCGDLTPHEFCSLNKPYYCYNGTLMQKPTECGCPKNTELQAGTCVSVFEKEPQGRTFDYIVKGSEGNIEMTVYGAFNRYLSGLPREYVCYGSCPTDLEIELGIINNPEQRPYLEKLVEKIKKESDDPNQQARIAISLVQSIPYDWSGLRTMNLDNRYPYEVLYDNKGVCGEKSRLLAFILRDLGFGVTMFNFDSEMHMAVGVSCPVEYSYRGTGYCFIETTRPSIITDSSGEYIGAGKLSSMPSIYHISNGNFLGEVSEEYKDAIEWNRIVSTAGTYLDQDTYSRYLYLVEKYGMDQETDEEYPYAGDVQIEPVVVYYPVDN